MTPSAAELKRFFQLSLDLLAIATTDGVLRWLNPSWQRTMGYELHELVDQTFYDFLHPDDRAACVAYAAELAQGAPSIEYINRLRHRDGSYRSISWNVGIDAERTTFFAIGRDVTDSEMLKRSLELLEKQRQHLQILDAITDLVLVKGPQSRIVWANRAFQAFYGMTNEQLHDLIDAPSVSPDFTQQYVKDDLQVFTTGKPLNIPQEPIARHDGATLYFHTVKTPIFDSDGHVVMTVGVSRDITERRQAEARLLTAQRETESLLATLSAILIGIDASGAITRWNQAAEKVFALPATAVLRRPWQTIGLPIDTRVLAERIDRVRATHRDQRIDELLVRPTPTTQCWLCVTISPSAVATEPGSVVVLGVDISDRKLRDAQRAQSQKMETVGSLATGVAHEINTPVQFIGDNLEFLRGSLAGYQQWRAAARAALAAPPGTPAAAQARAALDGLETTLDLAFADVEALKAIEQSLDGARHVGQIVRALKDFAHPDGGDQQLVDLNHLVVTTLIVARNEYKYVAEVTTELDPQLSPVQGNAGEICQVLLNLVVNAAHAIAERLPSGSPGKGHIVVVTRREEGCAVIAVADDGAGIPEAVRPKIFEPFFTTKPHGTGQGLYIAQTIIVGNHGGTIEVCSEVGQGTTVTVRLPLPADAPIQAKPRPAAVG